MFYSVNIGDLTRDLILGQFLVAPVIPSKRVVHAEKNLDGGAVVLETDEERAWAIVQVIRTKWAKHQIRCYESKTGRGGWKRIPDSRSPCAARSARWAYAGATPGNTY